MHLEVIKDDFVELTETAAWLDARQGSTHGQIVGLELRDDILAQTPGAEAHAVAEVADPAAVVFADVEVVIIAQLQTRVAKLPVASILRLLSQL